VTKKVYPVPIKIGLQDWDRTEIRSGLVEGDVAVIPPSAAIVKQFDHIMRIH